MRTKTQTRLYPGRQSTITSDAGVSTPANSQQTKKMDPLMNMFMKPQFSPIIDVNEDLENEDTTSNKKQFLSPASNLLSNFSVRKSSAGFPATNVKAFSLEVMEMKDSTLRVHEDKVDEVNLEREGP